MSVGEITSKINEQRIIMPVSVKKAGYMERDNNN